MKKVFGEKYDAKNDEVKLHNRPDYTVPKDKWKVGKELKELQKQFPHDRVLERMVQ
jgi:hypothetical protein